MRRREPPRPKLHEITPDERATFLALARQFQPVRPEADVEYWRPYVHRHWSGTELDDEAVLLVAPSGSLITQAATPLVRRYLEKLLAVPALPDATRVRAALLKDGAPPFGWLLQGFVARVERLDTELAELQEIARDIYLRFRIWVTLWKIRRQFPFPSPQFQPNNARVFWRLRAETVHYLRAFLQSRHPADKQPPWRIVAAFLWRVGAWRVQPDDAGSVATLKGEYFRWRREQAPP